MGECWAASLGDCSGKTSREHLISAGLFSGEEVTVQGVSWCKEKPRTIRLAGLAAKILCVRHNNRLSKIDKAGAKTFRTLREADQLLAVRMPLKKRFWNVKRYRVDGLCLERWFLKTLVNICFDHEHPIGKASSRKGYPSLELVETALGAKEFVGRAGLYMVVHLGQKIATSSHFKFEPLIMKEERYVAGGLFIFYGFRFLLYLEPEGPPKRLTGVAFEGEDWGISELQFRNRAIRMEVAGRLSHVVEVEW